MTTDRAHEMLNQFVRLMEAATAEANDQPVFVARIGTDSSPATAPWHHIGFTHNGWTLDGEPVRVRDSYGGWNVPDEGDCSGPGMLLEELLGEIDECLEDRNG